MAFTFGTAIPLLAAAQPPRGNTPAALPMINRYGFTEEDDRLLVWYVFKNKLGPYTQGKSMWKYTAKLLNDMGFMSGATGEFLHAHWTKDIARKINDYLDKTVPALPFRVTITLEEWMSFIRDQRNVKRYPGKNKFNIVAYEANIWTLEHLPPYDYN